MLSFSKALWKVKLILSSHINMYIVPSFQMKIKTGFIDTLD